MRQFEEQLWTYQLDSEIRKLASNGWTPEQIARHLGKTPQAITGRAKKLRIDLVRELQNSWRNGSTPTRTDR